MTNPSEFWQALKQAESPILITAHQDPDVDAVGSCLAIRKILMQWHKDVSIWFDEPISNWMRFLPEYQLIHHELDSGFPYKTLVVCDSSSFDRVKSAHKVAGISTHFNIDHHSDNTEFGAFNLVEQRSSVGEILATHFLENQWPISADTATQLYAAIVFDTGRYLHPNVTANTFSVSAELAKLGANLSGINAQLFLNNDQSYFEDIKQALGDFHVEPDIGLVYSVIKECDPERGKSVIDFIRTHREARIAAVFRGLPGNIVKVNLRAKIEFDVADFAHQFGGGGHRKAAGITLKGKLPQVVDQVLGPLRHALS